MRLKKSKKIKNKRNTIKRINKPMIFKDKNEIPIIKKENVENIVKKTKKDYYINPEELTNEIQLYYKNGIISDTLALMIKKIADRLSFAPNFINYSFKLEMVGDAIVKMFTALHKKKFDLKRGFSPFVYFTMIAWNAFINRIKKEEKHRNTLTSHQVNVYEALMHVGINIEDTSNHHSDNSIDEYES